MRTANWKVLWLAMFATVAWMDGGALAAASGPEVRVRAIEDYGRQPLAFEENLGQADPRVRFLTRGDGYTLFLTPGEAVVALRSSGKSETSRVLRLGWTGGSTTPRISGVERLPGSRHYLVGSDPARWRTRIPAFARVLYDEVWPGIGLAFYGNPRELEFDLNVAPGADPEQIRLSFDGADDLRIDAAGDLVIRSGEEEVRLRQPISWQQAGGVRHGVESRWRLLPPAAGVRQAGVRLSSYDRARPLVVDPVLVYSTYLGGQQEEVGQGIATDAAGNSYVTGYTISSDFPLAAPLQPDLPGFDAFVTKLDPDGGFVYSTYLGGTRGDSGEAIAADEAGNAYVTGYTDSDDFPSVNALPPQYRRGKQDAFVAKLDPDGSALLYSTQLGGSAFEIASGIDVDPQGHAYVAGITGSTDFPTLNAFQSTSSSHTAFVTKLSIDGSSLVYSTYLGGRLGAWAHGIEIDDAGYAYVAGTTRSPDFPTVNAFQPTLGGGIQDNVDAFVTKLHPSGRSLVYSSFLGGSKTEFTADVGVDATGSAWVAGYTDSDDFPLRRPLQSTIRGYTDAYVTRIGPSGALIFSTFLGGTFLDGAPKVAADRAGNAYVTGFTGSIDFPLKEPVDDDCSPVGSWCRSYEAFVMQLTPAGTLAFSSFLGGFNDEHGRDIAADSRGSVYVTGYTNSFDFPTKHAVQPVLAGQFDAFVAKLQLQLNRPPDCSVATASPAVIWPANGRMVPVSVNGVTDPDGDPVTLTVIRITQDEPLSSKGPDASGLGTTRPAVRATRQGGGDGRVYHLTFTATDPQGASCTGTVTICVLHDQRPGAACGDGGALFGSTGSR